MRQLDDYQITDLEKRFIESERSLEFQQRINDCFIECWKLRAENKKLRQERVKNGD